MNINIYIYIYIYWILSRSLLLRMVNGKYFTQNLLRKSKRKILRSIIFSFEIRVVDEVMWKNSVERDRPHMTIWRMRIAGKIPTVTDTHTHTHTEYVTLIAFLLQQWLHQRAPLCVLLNYSPIYAWKFQVHQNCIS